MKHFSILFFIFLAFTSILLSSHFVFAIGIQGPPSSERLIIFQPYLEREYDFTLVNAERIHSYVRTIPESLSEYVTLIDPAQDTGPRSIRARVNLPATLEPGKYEILVGGSEISIGEGTVSALAAVQSRITVLSLYPDAFPEFTLSVSDVAINDSATFSVNVHNYGMQRINAAQAFISIYDSDNNLVTTLSTDTKPVDVKLDNPTVSTTLNALFDARRYNVKPGMYRASAKLVYNTIEFPTIQEKTFRIGTLNVYVTDWTHDVFVNSTNKFYVMIASDWSSPIEDVYARITTPNAGVLKTPNLDLSKFSSATLETYWETNGLALGAHEVTIEVFYQGQSSKTTAKVNVVEGLPPEEEKPARKPISITLDTTTIVLILMVIILIFNVYFFMFRGRGQPNNNSNNDYSNNNYNDDVRNDVKSTKKEHNPLRPPKL